MLYLQFAGNDTQFTEVEMLMLNNAVNSNDVAVQLNLFQRAKLASELTFDDCINVFDWISGK